MIELSNARIRLVLEPAYGRVVELHDRTSGRQWLISGPLSEDCGDDAIYGVEQARGWDECFPTISAGAHPSWGGRLRDHGVLWGRPWEVRQTETAAAETRFATKQFEFARKLVLRDDRMECRYALSNLSDRTLPYLWSQHCLLAVDTTDRLVVQGVKAFETRDGSFVWPDYRGRSLEKIGPRDEGFALKAYAAITQPVSIGIDGPEGGIRFEWGPEHAQACGLWLCYGGWTKERPVRQLAIEPTTARADDLPGADKRGEQKSLEPRGRHEWSVTIRLTFAPHVR